MESIDTYKYLTIIIILHVLLGFIVMADGTVSYEAEFLNASNSSFIIAMKGDTQTFNNMDELQTPQNENTQTEGSGGWSFSEVLTSIMAFFGLIFSSIGHAFSIVSEGINSSGMGRIFFLGFLIFYTLIMGYGLYKLINFLKNKDAQ